MKYNYAFEKIKENMVKVVGRDLNISTKQAIEICSFIKNKQLENARALLENVMKRQQAVPFKRFTEGAGHKKGLAAGKYPINASKQFLKLFKALEANAQNKGLSPDLRIIHACAQRAAEPLRYGRKRRITMKRAHVELVAQEVEHVKKEVKKIMRKKEKKEEPKGSEKIGEKEEKKSELKKVKTKKKLEKEESSRREEKTEIRKVEDKKGMPREKKKESSSVSDTKKTKDKND